MTEILRYVHSAPNIKTVIAVMGSQMSKTETALNVIGCILDDDPAPCLYIAPTKSFCEKVFEPRLRSMIDNTKTLAAKKRAGKQESKTQKEVAGVKVRLAWAGSATEIAGDPAKIVFVDERDRMDDDVGGEGDPKILADARHATYADGQTWVFSTPTEGVAEVEREDSGLEFWKIPQDMDSIGSATWKLFLEGTRHHWAIPCPSCEEFFIPRFALLTWPDDATPEQAQDQACMICANCGTLIDQAYKPELHQRGVLVAPGQRITPTGKVLGLVKETDTLSFWVSGLMSPWKSWGDRASSYVKALNSGDPEKIQAVLNTGFGELFSIGGERTDEDLLKSLGMAYKRGDVLDSCSALTCGVDVQQDRIYWQVDAWGPDMVSCRVDYGVLFGDTSQLEVFNDLAGLRERAYGGLHIERMLIDSGYRASFVYDFCRRESMRGWAIPSKGRGTIESSPLIRTKLDVGRNSGRRLLGGLALYNVNTDYFKKWLTERFKRDPSLPGGWYLPEDVTEEFIAAMRSEVRVVKPNGSAEWIKLDANNHLWDTAVLNLACAYSLNLQMITGDQADRERHRQRERDQRNEKIDNAPAPNAAQQRRDPFRNSNKTGAGHFNKPGGWFGR